MDYVIGVDVGTGSARAGLFDETGKMYAKASKAIALHRPEPEWAEQSSEQIWASICYAVKKCLKDADISGDQIKGLSFSATCSLVLLGEGDAPLNLTQKDDGYNIIVWMDHRAIDEAEKITQTGAAVLKNVGGVMSPEMEIPKLMWLKQHRPDIWDKLHFAGDLADFLTYRACGSTERSVCTLGCKWTYDPDAAGWDKTFLKSVGLDDLLQKAQLPEKALPVGAPLGALSEKSAQELGLSTNCQVAVGLIDAHAGALGTLGHYVEDHLETRMALIAGTSNCHIALNPSRCEVPGVWGPYGGAVIDGFWCTEGGQSVTGALLDHMINLFAPDEYDQTSHAQITEKLTQIVAENPDFAADVHVIPDFLGNRAPFADPHLKGAISGLSLEDKTSTFLKVYFASIAAIACGTRLIIEQLNDYGYDIQNIHLSGGHKKSELFVKMYADMSGCDVLISDAEEPVLLGAAIAAFAQFEAQNPIASVTSKMKHKVSRIAPNPQAQKTHENRYQAFLRHYEQLGLGHVLPKGEAVKTQNLRVANT